MDRRAGHIPVALMVKDYFTCDFIPPPTGVDTTKIPATWSQLRVYNIQNEHTKYVCAVSACYTYHHTNTLIRCDSLMPLLMDIHTTSINSLRLRGGGGDANSSKDYNQIPYLTNMNFKWNGLPCIDFQERVLYPLNNGLGSVLCNGATLLATCKRSDPGAIHGTPSTAAAAALTAAGDSSVEDDHKLRVIRAFCCLLNYIDHRSEVYMLYMRGFQQDGAAVYAHMTSYGVIPTPQRIIDSRVDYWNRMTFDTLKLPYTIEGYFKWAEIVTAQARKLGYSADKIRDKLCQGMPAFFKTQAVAMRDNGSFNLPATYGGINAFIGTPLASIAHPHAGKVDVDRLMRFYLPVWVEQCATVKHGVPTGMVRSVDADSETFHEEVKAILASDIKPDSECHACKGFGHYASQILSNGKVYHCANKAIAADKAGKSLLGMEDQFAKTVDILATKLENLSDSISDQIDKLANQISTKRLSKTRMPRAVTPPRRRVSEPSANSTEGSPSEEDSDGESEASMIEEMADAISTYRKPYKQRPHRK